MLPGKANTLLADWSDTAQEKWFMLDYSGLVGWLYFKHLLYVIIMLGKSPITWRQRSGMTLAVDWDFKHQLKQNLYLSRLPILSAHYTTDLGSGEEED